MLKLFFNIKLRSDYSGIVGALQNRVLTNKHLFWRTHDQIFAIQARADAQVSLEVAELHNLNERLGSCYFRLGEIAMLFEQYNQAVENYQQALNNFSGTNCERGDYRYHLGESLYRSGKKEEGKKTMMQGLKEIQDNAGEVDPFLVHVWESGCYLRLAELLKSDKLTEARDYLERARQIIENDHQLVIRKAQLEKLEAELK